MTGQDDQPTLDQGATPSFLTPRLRSPAGVPPRYEILRELGSGGMGVVYQARDKETGETVALKVLQPEIAADATALERFKNELRLARKITHKNVCRIYEFHSATGGACISMEYVEGQSLRALLSPVEGLSVQQGLKIARQVLAGVAEAHAQGVVHRDLKPENIMITPDGTAKVMDFGIAVTGSTGTTLRGAVAGTPAYMSPEQAEGKAADARSDIYALGLVMFEVFTGRAAMAGETPLAVVHKQIYHVPHPPREYEPDLPERIDRAIQKCLEKDPKRRFASVAELETALERNAPLSAELEEADPAPSPHLAAWGRLDWALVILAMIGFIYFLNFRDRVFPASRIRLEVDVITARRTVQDMIQRLPIASFKADGAHLEFRGWLRQHPWDSDRRLDKVADWPVMWYAEPLVWIFSGRKQKAVVDRTGKLESLTAAESVPSPQADYRPPPPDERRRIATHVAETVCGPFSSGFRLRETAGGEFGATYKAEWVGLLKRSRIIGTQVRVDLQGEKVVGVQCNVPVEGSRLDVDTFLIPVRWLAACLFTLMLGTIFIMGRSYRLPAARTRLGLAVPLGAILAAIAYGTLSDVTTWDPEMGQAPRTAVWVVSTIAFSAVMWMALTTAEHRLRRDCPQWIASYLLMWRGRLTHDSVLLALVRGSLASVILIAFETLLAHATLLRNPGELLQERRPGYFQFFVAHEPIAQAVGMPALFTVAAALLSAVLIGLVFLGTITAGSSRDLNSASRSRRLLAGFFGIPVMWWATTLHLYLADFLFPPAGIWLVFYVEAVFLAWLLRRFDVLTVMAAVFTAVLWIMNYPLLEIFRDVGNGAHVAVLWGWALLVMGAAAMAFRRQLTDRWQGLREKME